MEGYGWSPQRASFVTKMAKPEDWIPPADFRAMAVSTSRMTTTAQNGSTCTAEFCELQTHALCLVEVFSIEDSGEVL